MSGTDASFSDNDEFEWTTPLRLYGHKTRTPKKELKPRPHPQRRHVPALKAPRINKPQGGPLLSFQKFQRNLNPNARHVRVRSVVLNNWKFAVLSQGVILGEESNQCAFLTLAAALGIDAGAFRQDVRHGAFAFRASQEQVLDQPQNTCIPNCANFLQLQPSS